MSNTRHVVVVRRDLQLSAGLLAAQVAHISDAFMRSAIVKANDQKYVFDDVEIEWMKEPYISVLAVNTKEELERVIEEAEGNKLPVHKWIDIVPSHIFEGQSIRALVGVSIGPDDFDRIKLVTGVLPLY